MSETTKQEPEGGAPHEPKVDAAAINQLILDHVGYSMVAGAIPVPIFDIAAVTAIQIDMLRQMANRYAVDFREERGKSLAAALTGATVGNLLGKMGASALKAVPGIGTILGIGSQALLAGASTYALGKVFQSHFDRDGTLFNADLSTLRSEFNAFMAKGRNVAAEMQKGQSADEIIATIEKLKALKDAGTISDKEFEVSKKELLAKLSR